jgi:hypothetical protein
VFTERLGLEEARTTLGLTSDAGWDEVRPVFPRAATESMARLADDDEAAVRAFEGPGPVEEKAEAVQAAKFRLEADTAYLAEQPQKLEAEVEQSTGTVLSRSEAM